MAKAKKPSGMKTEKKMGAKSTSRAKRSSDAVAEPSPKEKAAEHYVSDDISIDSAIAKELEKTKSESTQMPPSIRSAEQLNRQKPGSIDGVDSAENSQVSKKEKIIVKGIFAEERVILENSDASRELLNISCYGASTDDGRVQISLCEALYLIERGKVVVHDMKGKPIGQDSFLTKATKAEPNFWVRYCVFKNIRNRGYVIKTALKFGADFRIYDRGVKPGEDHARWIVYPVHEGTTLTWHEFAAKNRVAHSTKKRLMIGIVDDEGDVTYYEIKWIRP